MTEAYIGAILGVVARTLVPYLIHLKNHPDTKFDRKYFIPIIAGLALSLIASNLVLQNVDANVGYFGGFASGWGLQDVSREVQKLLGFE